MATLAIKYEALCRAILVIVVVNIAFAAFTLRGFVIGGFFPSIAASSSVLRTWLLDDDRSWGVRRTWRTFAEAWHAEYPRANRPGVLMALFAVWLYVDHRVLSQVRVDGLGLAMSGLLLMVIALYILFCGYFWVLRAHYDDTEWHIAKLAAPMIVARPLTSAVIGASYLILIWAGLQWPGLLVALGPAGLMFVNCAVVYSFSRVPGYDAHEPAPATPAGV